MSDNIKKNNVIDSHIQMPKVLLKRFHNEHNRFYYYDVEKKLIGNGGTAKSINTKEGYYSKVMEDYFRDNIETPFSKVLAHIEKTGIDGETFSMKASYQHTIKRFMYALIARGPSFSYQMNNAEDFWGNFPEQFQHDYIAKNGIRIASEYDVLSSYIVTFMHNKTEIPFVLSMDGIYNYTLNGHSVINLPVSTEVTISLIHKSYSKRIVKDNQSVAMFEVNNPDNIKIMNRCAFSAQVKRKWGYVVCPQKNELERLQSECE